MPKDVVGVENSEVEVIGGRNDDKMLMFVRLPDGFEAVVSGGEVCEEGLYLRFPKKKFGDIFKKQMEQDGEMLSVLFDQNEVSALVHALKDMGLGGDE